MSPEIDPRTAGFVGTRPEPWWATHPPAPEPRLGSRRHWPIALGAILVAALFLGLLAVGIAAVTGRSSSTRFVPAAAPPTQVSSQGSGQVSSYGSAPHTPAPRGFGPNTSDGAQVPTGHWLGALFGGGPAYLEDIEIRYRGGRATATSYISTLGCTAEGDAVSDGESTTVALHPVSDPRHLCSDSATVRLVPLPAGMAHMDVVESCDENGLCRPGSYRGDLLGLDGS